MYRRKLQGKLKESDESLNELQAKYSSLDKAKNHIAAELEDLNLDLEKAREHQKAISLCWLFHYGCSLQERNRSLGLEKKQKQVDKQITEWKSKHDGKEAELDQSKRETHAASTEV